MPSVSWQPAFMIDLDKVPKKYAGLDGTEIAISESQERMAVVVDPKDVDAFLGLCRRGEPGGRYGGSGYRRARDWRMTWRGKDHRRHQPRVPGYQRRAPGGRRDLWTVPEPGRNTRLSRKEVGDVKESMAEHAGST